MIYDEVRALLYSKNTFHFDFTYGLRIDHIRDRSFIAESEVEKQCRQLYEYTPNASPEALRQSTFARFLHEIGRQNASNLTAVSLYINRVFDVNSNEIWCDHIVPITETTMLVLNLYAPNLRKLISVCNIGGSDISGDANRTRPSGPKGSAQIVEEEVFYLLQQYLGKLKNLRHLVGGLRDTSILRKHFTVMKTVSFAMRQV